jgi:hypothetical protein
VGHLNNVAFPALSFVPELHNFLPCAAFCVMNFLTSSHLYLNLALRCSFVFISITSFGFSLSILQTCPCYLMFYLLIPRQECHGSSSQQIGTVGLEVQVSITHNWAVPRNKFLYCTVNFKLNIWSGYLQLGYTFWLTLSV